MHFRHTTRTLSRVGLAAAAATAVLGGTLLAASGPASADPTGDIHNVVINEVESNGDTTHGDWIELYNNDPNAVDLSGAILSDNDNSHELLIPSGTTIASGGFYAMQVDNASVSGNFGLGAADSARLFEAGTTDLGDPGFGELVDSYSWTEHAATTYGRDPDGGTTWATTSGGTFDAANQFGATVGNISGVVINEVESNGDATHGDWIELYNTNATATNIGGAILSDNDNAHQLDIPSGTVITGHGYYAEQVDNASVAGNFGLGSSDKARLFAPGDVTLSSPVDSYTWTSHAVVTYGRNRSSAGDPGAWASTSVSTYDAANQFGTVTAPSLTGVKISEVKTTGDDVHGDWIELHNTTGSSVDLSGAILSDNDNSHIFRIPSSTSLAAGGYQAFRVDDPTVAGNFGLGDNDKARLFKANVTSLTGTPVDSESWTNHQPTSWGLNSSGVWAETHKPTFGAANDFTSTITPDISWVVLNEIESNGDASHGDWVELHNTSTATIDLSGAVLSDSENDHFVTIPSGTSIGSNGYYAIQVDDPALAGNFGLGSNDAVRFYRANTVPSDTAIPLDHEEWTSHSVTTLGRTDGGLGDWTNTCTSTFDAANDFSCTP